MDAVTEDFPDRARVDDWSLRAALVRFAQPHPELAAAVAEAVRRASAVLTDDALRRDLGPDAVSLAVRAAEILDALGDDLAAWACAMTEPAPVGEAERAAAEALRLLRAAGVDAHAGPRRR